MADRLYLGGVTDTVVHAETDGTLIVEERQDCEGILAHNQRMRDSRFHGGSAGGTVQEAYNVPMVEVLRWQRECGAPLFSDEHMAYMAAKLRQAEFSKLAAAPKIRDPRVIVKGLR